MMSNTNIKVVYDFYNQQPDNLEDKLTALASKNAVQVKGSDSVKTKRSNISTMNTKRAVPQTIKIEGEIEESERDNRFARHPTENKKSSNTPNKQGISSVSKGRTSDAGKSVNKQPAANKSKSPMRSVSPLNNKANQTKTDNKESTLTKQTESKINKTSAKENKEKLNESTCSIKLDELIISKNGAIKHSNSFNNISNRSVTPNARSKRNPGTSSTKLNRSFTNADNSSSRPKTPKPNPPKNCKISTINKINTNINILSTTNGDNTENSENTKEIKNIRTTNPSIYNSQVKNVSKIQPLKMNQTSKKSVIEGTLADGDETESSVNANKSKLDQFKEQNMFNNKNANIFQLAKDEKESKMKYGNVANKKLNIQDPNEMNNSYNILNRKKIDLKFISTSPIIRVK
jgi:hypothetical protein